MTLKFVVSLLLLLINNSLLYSQIISWKEDFGVSSNCQLNLNDNNLSLENEIKDNLARSVVLFEINTGEITGPNYQTQTCSATILAKEGNGNPTPEYYILTARHCLHQDKECSVLSPGGCINNNGLGAYYDTSNVRLHFNQSIPNSALVKPDFLNHFAQGSVSVVEESLANDLVLLKFNGHIPPHFKPYFAGWSASLLNTNTFSGNFCMLHHPKRDVKKVSMAHWYDVYDGSVAVSAAFIASPWFGVALSSGLTDKIYVDLDKSNGLAENVSSGSCLINGNNKVIGAFSWGINGEQSCSSSNVNSKPDKSVAFGKFRKFYLVNQSVRNALGVSLPQMSLSGKELTCYNSLIALNGNFYPANSYQPNNAIALNSDSVITTNGNLKIISGADFTFTAAESIDLLPGFEIEAGAEFTAEIVPCANLNYRMAQPQEEYMTRADSLYMDSLIVNNITPFKEDSAAWFNIMEELYPHILQNQDSLELYWGYLGYGPLRPTNAKSVTPNKKDYVITDYKLSTKSVNLTSTTQKISIYPNPNKGEFVLELSNAPKGNYSLQITDAVGRSVIQQNYTVQEQTLKQNINLQAHGKGIYFIKINSEKINELRKIVVE